MLSLAGLAAFTTPASAAVLHDQYNNAATGGTTGVGSAKTPSTSAEVADDFNVPAGKVWVIDRVEAQSGNGTATNSFNVFFYPNAATNVPQETPEYSGLALPSSSGHFAVNISLNPPASLPAGRHWVEVQANYSQNGQNWFWTTRTLLDGFASAVRGQSGCNTWTPRGTCTPSAADNPDQVFRVSGTETDAPPPATGGTTQTGQAGQAGGSATTDAAPRFNGNPSAAPSTFEVNLAGAAETPVSGVAAKKGTTFKYSLSEAASVTFTIQRKGTGRRVRGKCRKPTRRNRRRKKCTRYSRVGAFRQQGKAGSNSKPFSGKIGRKVLRPGRYRAQLVARDAAGNRSAPRNVPFRVVKAARKRR